MIGQIIAWVYLFGVFVAIRFAYRIIDREMWSEYRDNDIAEHVMSFVLALVAAFFWPFTLPYAWATHDIPSRAVRKAHRQAKAARELEQAERELADATRSLERSQEPYGGVAGGDYR